MPRPLSSLQTYLDSLQWRMSLVRAPQIQVSSKQAMGRRVRPWISGMDKPFGSSGVSFIRSIPLEKAMSSTLLAYEMNVETLPLKHGYPLRALALGWTGTNCAKLGRCYKARYRSHRSVWTLRSADDITIPRCFSAKIKIDAFEVIMRLFAESPTGISSLIGQ